MVLMRLTACAMTFGYLISTFSHGLSYPTSVAWRAFTELLLREGTPGRLPMNHPYLRIFVGETVAITVWNHVYQRCYQRLKDATI